MRLLTQSLYLITRFSWSVERSGRTHYAKRKKDYKELRMHRIIMGAPDGVLVDHINGNGLDNRRSNLRFCNNAQNQQNAGPRRPGKFKGVSETGSHTYRAVIHINRRQISLGSYPTAEEAALAYDAGAVRYFGEFARLNFPGVTR